jgi:hypothetical protein
MIRVESDRDGGLGRIVAERLGDERRRNRVLRAAVRGPAPAGLVAAPRRARPAPLPRPEPALVPELQAGVVRAVPAVRVARGMTWIQQLAHPLRIRCAWRNATWRCEQDLCTFVERVACGGVVRWLCWRHSTSQGE